MTLRDRDSTEQLRIPTPEVAEVVHSLCTGTTKWADIAARYPKQKGSEADEVAEK